MPGSKEKDDKSKQIEVSIAMEDGDLLGVTTDAHMRITNIQALTLADGTLRVGDQLLKVNGRNIENKDHFYKLLRFAPPVANFTVLRQDAITLAKVEKSEGTKTVVGAPGPKKKQENEDSAKTCIPLPISDVTIPTTDEATKQVSKTSILPEAKSTEQPKSEDTKTCIILLTESALTASQVQRIENLVVKTGKCGPLPIKGSTKLDDLSARCRILEDRNAHLKNLIKDFQAKLDKQKKQLDEHTAMLLKVKAHQQSKVPKEKEMKAEHENICHRNHQEAEKEKEDKTSDGDKISTKKLDDKTSTDDNIAAGPKK